MYFRCCAIVVTIITSTVLGQDYTITPLSIIKCPVTDGEEIKYEVHLNAEKDGTKSFSYKLDLKQVLDKDCTYKVYVDVMSGVKYVRYMEGDGKVFEAIDRLIKQAWQRLRIATNPNIKESNAIHPGSYSANHFQVGKDEVSMPIPSKGKYKVVIHLFCQNVKRACVMGELLISENN